LDYELNRHVFKVFVSGDFLELLGKPSKRLPKWDTLSPYEAIQTKEDLLHNIENYISLWSLPYVIMEYHPTYAIFKDRGVRFRAWVYKKRFYELINHTPKKWFKVSGGRSKHVVITVTLNQDNLPLGEAYKRIKVRVREVINYFKKYYGVKAYLGVYEIHENGYPHAHLIIFLKKPIPTFRYKKMRRFTYKRLWDKDLKVNEKGFIDCFALSNGKEGAKRYFSKYLSKAFIPNNSEEITVDNLKQLSLYVFRLFRIRPIIASLNLRRKLPKPTPLKLEDLQYLNPREYELYKLGKFITEYKPSNLEELKKFNEVLSKRLDNISPNLVSDYTEREKIINAALMTYYKWEKYVKPLGYTYVFSAVEN